MQIAPNEAKTKQSNIFITSSGGFFREYMAMLASRLAGLNILG